MRYEKQYNRARNEWWVYSVGTAGAVLVKTFKTEAAADRWIKKQG